MSSGEFPDWRLDTPVFSEWGMSKKGRSEHAEADLEDDRRHYSSAAVNRDVEKLLQCAFSDKPIPSTPIRHMLATDVSASVFQRDRVIRRLDRHEARGANLVRNQTGQKMVRGLSET
jgi:hypothetical protein